MHKTSTSPWKIWNHISDQQDLAKRFWPSLGCWSRMLKGFPRETQGCSTLETFLKSLLLQWILVLFTHLRCGLGATYHHWFTEEHGLSTGLPATLVFTQPMMQEGCTHLRNLHECYAWKVSQNLALANCRLKDTLNLKCVLKLVIKPPPSTEMIFLYIGSLICYRRGESQGDLFVIFCIAAWSEKHLLSASVFCYQLVSVTSTGLLGTAIIAQQKVLLKCQGSMLTRCCCSLCLGGAIHLSS